MGWGPTGDTYQPTVRVKLTFGARCICCYWFKGNGTCEAFPKGIPLAILTNEHDHVNPYPGDDGYLWRSGIHVVRD